METKTEERMRELADAAEKMADAIHYVQAAQRRNLAFTRGGDMLDDALAGYLALREKAGYGAKADWTPYYNG